jgi:transcriptional regulator with XRE-family HTH domain
MTVRQLAETAAIAPSSISRIENGSVVMPTPDVLQRLARGLGIDVEELYATVGQPFPNGLPSLRPYLRAKYGLSEDVANRIEGYFQALRDET